MTAEAAGDPPGTPFALLSLVHCRKLADSPRAARIEQGGSKPPAASHE
jgi:hypothetical protein